MLKFKDIKLIQVQDWNAFVSSTYNRPYNFQQQAGCRNRGVFSLSIPCHVFDLEEEEEMSDSIQEVINGNEMGVKFEIWLARDPNQPLSSIESSDWELNLFWKRNFYPSVYTVANDLYKKGLIEAGDYMINIDW